ncbi:hypothetical protein VU04_09385, partial [Desulfobulbus sp. TB]|nr:hypothetical protein [Desulfobulbus sp. TB]
MASRIRSGHRPVMVAQDTVKHLPLLFLGHDDHFLSSHDLLLPQILLNGMGTIVRIADFYGGFRDRQSGPTGSH